MTDETSASAAPEPPPSPPPAAAPPPTQTINIQAPPAAPTNGMAVAALVLGIVALFLFWIPFLGWIPVIVGLVLGIVAMQHPYGRGMAVAGLVCSGIALLLKVVFWVMVLGVFGAAATASHLHGY